MAQNDPPDPVDKQVATLADARLGRLAAKTLRDRHSPTVGGPPRGIGEPFTIDLHKQRGRETLMIARGELIVRAKDAAAVGRLLGESFAQTSVAIGPVGLVRFSGDVHAAHIIDTVRRLRTHGIDASPNAIMACGMRSKALASPKPADQPITITGAAGAGKNAHIVVIDTGIYEDADQRKDNLLANVKIDRTGSTNIDPLTAINAREGKGAFLDLAAGHGTFVAGNIGQIAPAASVTMIRALNSDGIGTTLEVANAIIAAANLKPDVINMSFATEDPDHANPIAIADAVAAAMVISPDTVFVAAAGNSPDSARTWPATLPGVVAVAGLAPGNVPSTWSKRGSWIDVSTLGQGIISSYVTGTEADDTDDDFADTWSGTDPIAVWTGTSFAAPRVAAAIATEVGNGLSPKDALAQLRAAGKPTTRWGVVLTI